MPNKCTSEIKNNEQEIEQITSIYPSKSDLLLWEEVRILSQDLKEGNLAVAKRRQGVPRDWGTMYKNSVAKALSTEQGGTRCGKSTARKRLVENGLAAVVLVVPGTVGN